MKLDVKMKSKMQRKHELTKVRVLSEQWSKCHPFDVLATLIDSLIDNWVQSDIASHHQFTYRRLIHYIHNDIQTSGNPLDSDTDFG